MIHVNHNDIALDGFFSRIFILVWDSLDIMKVIRDSDTW